MKLLISGGRDYTDRDRVHDEIMKALPTPMVVALSRGEVPDLVIVHGACPTGADRLADDWARWANVPVETYAANWRKYAYAAGPIRNSEMLEQSRPDVVLVFPGGKGTADLRRKAHVLRKSTRPELLIIEVPSDEG